MSDLGLARIRFVPRVLDAASGAIVPCANADPGLRALLGCSPWRDADGQFHLVARTVDPAGDLRWSPAGKILLARCTYPAGRVLGRMVLDRMPHGPVCWSPDARERIVFASGDGRLYRYDLPRGEWTRTVTGSARPIRWGCGPPGADGVFLQEPCWPAGLYRGGWLLASVRVLRADGRMSGACGCGG